MRRDRDLAIFLFLSFSSASLIQARPNTPLPFDAYDGGVVSAETLGRGATIASNHPTLASGSENPAALVGSGVSSSYGTVLVKTGSDLPKSSALQSDPLNGKVLQYMALGSEKGVVFFEPLARRSERQATILVSSSTDFRDVDFSANAIGVAGAENMGAGSIGLSLAYLWSSIGVDEHSSTQPEKFTTDTAEGVRLNIGARYPLGPTMWGVLAQNIPGFLWGKKYHRDMLPARLRIGNTWKVVPGVFFSIDLEERFYEEGGDKQKYIYVGNESYLSPTLVFRVGTFGTNLENGDDRHVTAGLSFIANEGVQLTYAFETFRQDSEKVNRSLISVQVPVGSKSTDDQPESDRGFGQ